MIASIATLVQVLFSNPRYNSTQTLRNEIKFVALTILDSTCCRKQPKLYCQKNFTICVNRCFSWHFDKIIFFDRVFYGVASWIHTRVTDVNANRFGLTRSHTIENALVRREPTGIRLYSYLNMLSSVESSADTFCYLKILRMKQNFGFVRSHRFDMVILRKPIMIHLSR